MPEKKNKSFGSYIQWLMKYALFAGYAAQLTACAVTYKNPDDINEALSMVPATSEITHRLITKGENGTLFGIKANKQPSIEDISSVGALTHAITTQSVMDRSSGYEDMFQDCLKHPEKYPKRLSTWISIANGLKGYGNDHYVATVIQAMINMSVLYDDAKSARGLMPNENWVSTITESAEKGTGVCGDVTLAKALLLSWALGKEKVWILTGTPNKTKGLNRLDHAVCVVELTSPDGATGHYVLDNSQTSTDSAQKKLQEMISLNMVSASVESQDGQNSADIVNYGIASLRSLASFSSLVEISRYLGGQDSPITRELRIEKPSVFYPLFAFNMADKNPLTEATLFDPTYVNLTFSGFPVALQLLKAQDHKALPTGVAPYVHNTFENDLDMAKRIMQISPMTEMLSEKLGGTISFSEPAGEAAPPPRSKTGANMRAYEVPSISPSLTTGPNRF